MSLAQQYPCDTFRTSNIVSHFTFLSVLAEKHLWFLVSCPLKLARVGSHTTAKLVIIYETLYDSNDHATLNIFYAWSLKPSFFWSFMTDP